MSGSIVGGSMRGRMVGGSMRGSMVGGSMGGSMTNSITGGSMGGIMRGSMAGRCLLHLHQPCLLRHPTAPLLHSTPPQLQLLTPPQPDPNDKCGTYFSAPRGMNDPGPCLPPNSNCSSPLCMKDFAFDDLCSCLWSSSTSSRYFRSLFSNPTHPPPLVIEVPATVNPTTLLQPLSTPPPSQLPTVSFTRTPPPFLRTRPSCSCDYELEQMLPLAVQAVDERKNLYRANMLLYQARETHICNRRRLMTCQPDGTCGCAPGTARREYQYQGKDFRILSYYCYATQGNCDEEPANLIKQLKRGVELV
ncbi:unnamed protein product [Orchesella dallaii]|uniref:Uncharacterized protein n=1 Tax=Orchesella dallaii TaxID=48710 RepID=A0ABP1RPQ0_9HEXA